jgi:hypothetical protein
MSSSEFECTLCCEDKFELYPRWIGESRICDACARDWVKPRFHAALEHEYQYPPMWGKERLDVRMFGDLFDEKFREAWRKKLQEYAVPVKKRLYCEHRDGASGIVCGEFLGLRGLGLAFCSSCRFYTCGDCGMSNDSTTVMRDHACKDTAKVDAFEKLQKGLHFQRCPDCEKEICQAEGCNHMICRPPCGAHFCFVCGKRVAAHLSGHWQLGGCPRFGVSGPRRIWDDPGEHSADETDDSDDDGGELDLLQHLRDVRSVQLLIDAFAGAERVESDGMETARGVRSISSAHRVRFFGEILANLDVVLEMMHNRFGVDPANQLREFNERHESIRNQYQSDRSNSDSQTNTVTNLSDLSDEFDTYFVFALETITDLNVIAAAHRSMP